MTINVNILRSPQAVNTTAKLVSKDGVVISQTSDLFNKGRQAIINYIVHEMIDIIQVRCKVCVKTQNGIIKCEQSYRNS